MMTRKPKLNLLYATDTSTPWLQLAVVTTEPNPRLQHARHWLAARACEKTASPATTIHLPRKH